jgi:hypothetical protein
MPQARKSARSSSRRATSFKEPAALKRLNQSLESAQKALTELRSHAGSNAAKGTQSLHKGLGKFLSDARRDSGKFTTALKRDFEQATKAAARTARSGASATSRRSTTRSGTSGTSKRTTTRRATAKRGTRKSS